MTNSCPSLLTHHHTPRQMKARVGNEGGEYLNENDLGTSPAGSPFLNDVS